MSITLGSIVRDPVTGLEGTVTCRCELLSGTTQYAVQPKAKDGMAENSVFVDENLLEVIDPGVSGKHTPADPTVTVEVGNEVEDKITGIKGVAIDKTTYINGCVYFGVLSKAEEGKVEAPKPLHVDHKRLKVLGKGMAREVEWPGSPRTGGPNRPGPSLREAR